MDEQKQHQEPAQVQPSYTLRECHGLIRVEVTGLEAQDEDGRTFRVCTTQFLGLPEHARAFGCDVIRRCLDEWKKCATDIGMERDALLSIARALGPNEERLLTAARTA